MENIRKYTISRAIAADYRIFRTRDFIVLENEPEIELQLVLSYHVCQKYTH